MSGYCPKCGNTICICDEIYHREQKVLIINDCQGCPYSQEDDWADRRYCTKFKEWKVIDNFPFPKWCPL